MNIRIVLADDHRMFREALCTPLAAEPDMCIVAETSNGAETLAAVEKTLPDVLLLDIGLPDMNGIEVASQVHQTQPQVAILALSGYADRMFIEEMLKAGALGYVVKSAGTEELLNAIRAVATGKSFLCTEATRRMLQGIRTGEEGNTTPPLTALSRREQEVLRLLARGMRSTMIASELGISMATVDVHRRNLRAKLGLRNIAELTRYAIRTGLTMA